MKKLTKKQAIHLLPAVVDNEADDDEKAAFLEFISHDKDVREQYENALLIKELLSSRFKREKAPERLKNKILKHLASKTIDSGITDDVDLDVQNRVKNSDSEKKPSYLKLLGSSTRYIAAAAVILFLSMITVQLLDRTAPHSTENIYVVENMAAEHFSIIDPQENDIPWQTFSITEAEEYLRNHFGINMTIPELEGARFDGLFMADFIEGYQTPLLGYSQPEINESIFIFAFNVDQIATHQHLVRNQEAVESCVYENDFYVAEISDHHVVSWLWDDNWYAAISNHNGYDLASIITPLDYNP